jgi:membrane protease YdiL (CAAX protease family)
VARALRIALAILLIVIGVVAVVVDVTFPYALTSNYGPDIAPDPVGSAMGALVGGVIAAACILGALHLLGAGRRIVPTGLIIIGLVVLGSFLGGWLGMRAHESKQATAASSTVERSMAAPVSS